ncbi:MAG: YebC/PmpR family DNA-binding transcriptional regulator [Clostridiaceae bacterium]|nr:YebC/PmpR family DNA-binding transcriptional regulator [Clostridiaceae bacterium]
MAGHSKWNNIKRRKAAVDAKKGKVFTKLGREIQVAIKEGGPDPEKNYSLQAAITRAKSFNMPNDTINRAIENATNPNTADFNEITYEGYGPAGIAIIVETLTDNRNRTAGEIRHVFDKYGGNLGKDGSVNFLFERKGTLILDRSKYQDADQVMLDAMEAGCSDFIESDEYYEIETTVEDYHEVLNNLTELKYEFVDVTLGPEAIIANEVEAAEDIEKLEKLLEKLEENDDVQDVFHNWNMPEISS